MPFDSLMFPLSLAILTHSKSSALPPCVIASRSTLVPFDIKELKSIEAGIYACKVSSPIVFLIYYQIFVSKVHEQKIRSTNCILHTAFAHQCVLLFELLQKSFLPPLHSFVGNNHLHLQHVAIFLIFPDSKLPTSFPSPASFLSSAFPHPSTTFRYLLVRKKLRKKAIVTSIFPGRSHFFPLCTQMLHPSSKLVELVNSLLYQPRTEL